MRVLLVHTWFLGKRDGWHLALLFLLMSLLGFSLFSGPDHCIPQFIFLALVAFWAESTWRDDPPGDREYLRSLPLSAFSQNLIRVGAAGIWLFVLMVSASILGLLLSWNGLTPSQISSFATPDWLLFHWPYLIPDTTAPASGRILLAWAMSAGIVFTSVSALSIALKRPGYGLAAIIVILIALLLVTERSGLMAYNEDLRHIFTGRFGLYYALFPTHRLSLDGGLDTSPFLLDLLPSGVWLFFSLAFMLGMSFFLNGHRRLLPTFLKPPVLILALVSAAIFTFGVLIVNRKSNPAADAGMTGRVSTVMLSYRYLWNPEDPGLLEWQILDQPSMLIKGIGDELLIADTGNARIVRCTTSGELIEVIGRIGSGPGEFQYPQDLFFDPDSAVLWVVDRSDLARVSRFQLTQGDSWFLGSVRVPSLFGPCPGYGIVLIGMDSFWICPRVGDTRLIQVDREGIVQQSIGERWHPEGIHAGAEWLFNQGYLNPVSDELFVFTWMFRPETELWTNNGNRILVGDLADLPEVEAVRRQSMPPGSALNFINSVAADSIDGHLYIQMNDIEGAAVFYSLGIPSLIPDQRFIGHLNRQTNLFSTVITLNQGIPSFYCLDRSEGSVLVMRPDS